ncbi:hypothetical protein [Demequina sp.]|uniref:hypothetical protein n=1 Tax=Demequina sp. TaxID=2050685 RepID=UPI0025B83DF0|nr:hypothetical protein [Demequina sp.]
MNTLLEAIGWIGSALIVISLMQARVLRFRWINMIGSIIATFYNAVLGIWPFVAMNAVIAVISAYWLRRLYREAQEPGGYQALQVPPDDPFLQHLLAVHAEDIASHQPDFVAQPGDPARSTLLVVRGDEAVGVVALHDAGGGQGVVELDWVKPRFRDFTAGQFVYRDSGALPEAGFSRVTVTPHGATDTEYLRKTGFRLEGDQWVRDLNAAA